MEHARMQRQHRWGHVESQVRGRGLVSKGLPGESAVLVSHFLADDIYKYLFCMYIYIYIYIYICICKCICIRICICTCIYSEAPAPSGKQRIEVNAAKKRRLVQKVAWQLCGERFTWTPINLDSIVDGINLSDLILLDIYWNWAVHKCWLYVSNCQHSY